MVDREKRKKNREEQVDRRRGPVHVEEDEAKAMEDDEEVSSTDHVHRLKLINRSLEDSWSFNVNENNETLKSHTSKKTADQILYLLNSGTKMKKSERWKHA